MGKAREIVSTVKALTVTNIKIGDIMKLPIAVSVSLAFAVSGCSGGDDLTSGSATAVTDDQACASLASMTVPSATVTAAQFVASSTAAGYQGISSTFAQPFCRVQITATPAPGADIKYEIWLPGTKAWNGRFLGTGNGGFAGQIVYDALANGLSRGYAVANTDVGTHATTGFIQMAGNRNLEENYHQRAIHQMTDLGKAVVQGYYKRKQDYALFAGCSSGGYEAMTEAENFPTDYNGIIAGAPGIDFGGLALFQGYSYVATQGMPGAAIPASKLPAIEATVFSQCDATDGLVDGQIDDPTKCHVSFEPLLCTGAETDSCLTRPEITALNTLRNGPVNPRTGQRYYPIFPAGAENSGGAKARIAHLNTNSTILDGSPGPLSWVLGANWTAAKWLTFNFDTDALNDLAAYAPYAPTNPNATPFMNAGGKLLIFHGLRDANIFAQSSVEYYNAVQSVMGAASVDRFSKLFLVPGMDHCSGGTGPNQFGQVNWKPPVSNAPETDIVASLDKWVTTGTAPEKIIAASYSGTTVTRTRPLCPYPQVAKYVSGDINAASNFQCASP